MNSIKVILRRLVHRRANNCPSPISNCVPQRSNQLTIAQCISQQMIECQSFLLRYTHIHVVQIVHSACIACSINAVRIRPLRSSANIAQTESINTYYLLYLSISIYTHMIRAQWNHTYHYHYYYPFLSMRSRACTHTFTPHQTNIMEKMSGKIF